MALTFTDAGGTEFDLDDQSTYYLINIEGTGMPNLALTALSRHGRPGSVLRRAGMPTRAVTLGVLVQSTSVSQHYTDLDNLVEACAGSYGRQEPQFGVLKWTRADSAVRSLRCIGNSGMSRARATRLTGTQSIIPVVFYADHPNWYNPTRQSDTITIGQNSGGPTWTVTWPVSWGLDGESGGASVANNGSAETHSLTWEVDGPITGPALTNLTTGQYVSFSGLTVPSNLTLRVRSGWEPGGDREPKAVLVSVGGAETNIIGYMDAGSRFPRLDPGSNSMIATQATEAATVHTVRWYDEYLAA